jgi:hypothetical protein
MSAWGLYFMSVSSKHVIAGLYGVSFSNKNVSVGVIFYEGFPVNMLQLSVKHYYFSVNHE